MSSEECVYFIQHGPSGPIKIGKTTGDASGRLKGLQTGNPYELRLLVTIPGGLDVEAKLHEKFAGWRRAKGEWFDPVPELLAFIDGATYQKRTTPPSPPASSLDDADKAELLVEVELLRGAIDRSRALCVDVEWEQAYARALVLVSKEDRWDSPPPSSPLWVEWATKLVGTPPPPAVAERLASHSNKIAIDMLECVARLCEQVGAPTDVAAVPVEPNNA